MKPFQSIQAWKADSERNMMMMTMMIQDYKNEDPQSVIDNGRL